MTVSRHRIPAGSAGPTSNSWRSRWAVVGCLVALVATACSGPPAAPEPVLRPVRWSTVSATDDARVRRFSGSVRAGVESRLSFRVPGTIVELPVAVGDRVAKGDLIGRLEPRDFQLQVEDARANLTQALANQRNAESEYARVRELYENDNAAKAQLDQARAAAESASAQVESIRRRLELAERQLDYTTLTAPVAGTIATVNTEVNENVQTGQPIVSLTSGARPEVQVSIPEGLIASIREGQEVEVRLDALPGMVLAARVAEVGVIASGGTTFPVTARLEDEPRGVRPGMAAEVTFRFDQGEGGRIVVPAAAVGEDRRGRHVFVVDPEGDGTGVVRRRDVVVGDLTGDGLEVLDGLEPGDRLVTAGVSLLADGRRVRMDGAAS